MQVINKRHKKNRLKAHRMIVRFLKQCWDIYSNQYINCSFSDFRKNKHFTSLLYKEQKGLCCYCMRALDLNIKGMYTLEHVMPHNVKESDVAYYYTHVPHLKKLVRKLKIDKNTPRLVKLSPYPHFCAYENLVLSCSGAIYTTNEPEKEIVRNLHECCNNARGNDRILPMFFDQKSEFDYNDDGTMFFPKKYEESIRSLRLESNDNLKLIRKTWSELMRLYSVEDVRRAIDDKPFRIEMILDTTLDIYEAKRMTNDLYWNLLYEYRWFGSYFLYRHNKNRKIQNN